MGSLRWRDDRGKWQADYRDEHGQRQRPLLPHGKKEKKKASAWLNAEETLIAQIKNGLARRGGDPLLQDLVDEYLVWYESTRAGTSGTVTRGRLEKIVGHLRRKGVKTIKALARVHVEAYQRHEKAQENALSAGTINGRVSALSTVLNKAEQDGVIDRNPIRGIERLKDDGTRARRNKKNRRALTQDEADAILAASKPQLRLIWRTYLMAGLRGAELTNLRRADLDATGARLCIRGATTKRREHGEDTWQPIPRGLAKDIAAHALQHGSDWLFPNPQGTGRNPRSLLPTLYACLRRVGISDQGEVDIQSLRKTYCTRMANQRPRLSLKDLQESCRHKDITTTMRYYIEADEAEIRRAVDQLEDQA